MPKVVVCGLGQVGFRTTELLLRLGVRVAVVTQNSREEFVSLVRAHGAEVILGDGRLDKNLIDAGILEAEAFVACADRDVTNIEVSLDALRLNPKVRVIARLFDLNLGRRLEGSIGIHRALAMSAIAAPAFASAAYGEAVRGSFAFEGKSMIVGEVPGSTKLAEYADVKKAGLLRRRSRSGSSVYEPDPEMCKSPDVLTEVLTTKERFLRLSGKESATTIHMAAVKRKRWKVPERVTESFRVIGAVWENAPRSLRGFLIGVFFLAVVSVFIFQFGMGWSPLDAVYFVAVTLTTTGYGDFNLQQAPVAIKLYGILVLLLGSVTIATLYSILTDFIVSTRFDQVLGRQKVASEEHVIVVGFGNVGFRVYTELRKMGSEVVVIDLDGNCEYRTLAEKGTPFIAGDARDAETLRRAGIDTATAVVAASDDDSVNLSVALMAKDLNPGTRTVVRIFDPDFAAKVQSAIKVEAAMSATKIAAPCFVGTALFSEALFSCVIGDHFCVVQPADAHEAPGRLKPAHSFPCYEEGGTPLRVDLFELKTFAIAE